MATVLIIGAGVSGLSAGIRALKSGHRVVICEKHAHPGGNLTGWKRGGFYIDNCIHWLTGTNPATENHKLWEELGMLGDGVKVTQHEALYTSFGDMPVSLFADIGKLKDELIALSPEDARAIRGFLRALHEMQGLGGIAGPAQNERFGPLRSALAYLRLSKYAFLSIGDFASGFKHPALKRFFSSFLPEELSSLMFLSTAATFCGGNGGLPEGGSFAAAQRMAKRFTELGGDLRLCKEAVKVDLDRGRARGVRFADGKELFADYIVLTQDPLLIFGGLLDAGMPKRMKDRNEDRGFFRFSSFHCAFSCDLPVLPFKNDLTLRLGEDQAFRFRCGTLLLRPFEKGAPDGKTLVQSMIFLTQSEAEDLIALADSKELYKRKKERLAALTVKEIEKALPCLAGKLELVDCWTPATYRRYTGSPTGSYMSFVFGRGRLPTPLSCRVPHIENLVLATQWQRPPGGLPIAAAVGRRAAFEIERLEQRSKRRSAAPLAAEVRQ